MSSIKMRMKTITPSFRPVLFSFGCAKFRWPGQKCFQFSRTLSNGLFDSLKLPIYRCKLWHFSLLEYIFCHNWAAKMRSKQESDY